PGWYPENDWQGFVPADELPRAKNPSCGFLVTANQDVNQLGRAKPQNAAMADYRADRLSRRLSESGALDVAACRALQYDTFSLQAQAFIERLRPCLPDTAAGRLLAGWDYRYEARSDAAELFEAFYTELIQVVIGEHVLGPEVTAHLANTTSLFASFFKNIDPLLLDPPPELCAHVSRDELYREAFARAARRLSEPPPPRDQLTLKHLFFGGRLPHWTGFDRGPFALPGSRASPFQTQYFEAAGRAYCLAPSIRLIADLGEDVLHSNLAGGPSDRRFSRWYGSDLPGWLDGTYKVLRAEL
ncbi:MAG TPA: penicillin acylase family protein, partial [Polyangiaceae bacterium]|nr:penicillin acylase family protein [Polyangiaceae bacterium]